MANRKKTRATVGADIRLESIKQSIYGAFAVKSKKKAYIILAAVTVAFLFYKVYFSLMPINIASSDFRMTLVILGLVWSSAFFIREKGKEVEAAPIKLKNNPLFIAVCAFAALIVLVAAATSPLFMSNGYRELIDVKESAAFAEEVENYDTMLIPTVDEALAMKLGDKKLGEDNYGSQFEIRDYNLIEYGGKLFWIAPIEYRGFFQWLNKSTTPGYILVNAEDQSDVKIVRREMPYVQSAFLWDDIDRKIYFQNMFRLLGSAHLELDDNGEPVYVQSLLKKRFALVNGLDSDGAIITDATTGVSKYYKKADVPSWADVVQPVDVVDNQLNYRGRYVHGYFNSLFAKKDVLQISEGVNFIFSNGDVYLYTGLTSVGADESIVGMSLTNMRTKESFLYRVSGATEYAASQSALGVEQAMRFSASSPLLINYNGIPTYFMILKDDEGLVKRYAYVNVSDYTVVATAPDINSALSAYAAKVTPIKQTTAELAVKAVSSAVIDGNTVYMLRFVNPLSPDQPDYEADFERVVFRASIKISDELPFAAVGDKFLVTYVRGAGENSITALKRI